MNIAVFRHQQSVGLGSLADTLNRHKISWRYFDAFAVDLSGFDPCESDVLIVLGGAPGVYQADIYPFLDDEVNILQKRLEKDLPTLGICLGAQLMASALGAKVYPGENGVERGWHPLTLTEAGKQSPLQYFDADKTNMFQWHGDTFDLPDGTTLLASSAQYKNQAFSYGKNALAIQSHPEITREGLEEWLVSKAADVTRGKIDPAELRRQTEQYGSKLVEQAAKFLESWLDSVQH